jgi:hypothetical protein
MNNNFQKNNCSCEINSVQTESWRSLLESTTWVNCTVILHNLPFKKYEKIFSYKVNFSYSSLYELQKSAVFWSLPDFKESLDR